MGSRLRQVARRLRGYVLIEGVARFTAFMLAVLAAWPEVGCSQLRSEVHSEKAEALFIQLTPMGQ
ncbi:MAG: hypothetical protein IID42_05600 [Planctomycetes bacterium]|nr:hypothetical protein [Planctomycetota bacterium]